MSSNLNLSSGEINFDEMWIAKRAHPEVYANRRNYMEEEGDCFPLVPLKSYLEKFGFDHDDLFQRSVYVKRIGRCEMPCLLQSANYKFPNVYYKDYKPRGQHIFALSLITGVYVTREEFRSM